MQEFICKNCGASLDLSQAENGVIKCGFCRSVFTVPKPVTSPASLNFLYMGEHDLDACNFDGAYTAFKTAAELDLNEPEAYFKTALAEFKVQYIKDAVNNCLQPICHEITDKEFTQNKNYLRALELASPAQRVQYERMGDDIDYIRKTFFELKKAGVKYDCFICVKVTDDNTKMRTSDYKDADDIYFELKGKGYRPFFSERELRNVTGADYEARILYALYSAECMLVVCGNEEYLQTPWVKNEYTRFLKLIGDDEKESDSITLVFSGLPIEKLPGKRGRIQAINLNQLNAFERIVSFVETHTPEARKRREEEKLIKERREAESERKLQELEERLRNMQSAPVQPSAPAGNSSANMFLVLANQFLSSGDFANAKTYFTTVTAADNYNAEAYWGLFLTGMKVSDEDKIPLFSAIDFDDVNFKKARYYAGEQLKSRIENFVLKHEGASAKFRLVNVLYSIEKIYRKEEQERARREAEENRKRDERERNIKMVEAEKARREKAAAERAQREKLEAKQKWLADFKIVNGELVKYLGNSRDIVIPDCVVSIANNAFGIQKFALSLTIPGSVKRIGSCIIESPVLNELIIGGGVSEIEAHAFTGLNRLKSVIIPKSVKIIGKGAFLSEQDITVYCEADNAPNGWHTKWCKRNIGLGNKQHKVIWSYKGKKI